MLGILFLLLCRAASGFPFPAPAHAPQAQTRQHQDREAQRHQQQTARLHGDAGGDHRLLVVDEAVRGILVQRAGGGEAFTAVHGGRIAGGGEVFLLDRVSAALWDALDRELLAVLEGEGRLAVGVRGDAGLRTLTGEGGIRKSQVVLVLQGKREGEGLEPAAEVAGDGLTDRQVIEDGRVLVGDGRGEGGLRVGL